MNDKILLAGWYPIERNGRLEFALYYSCPIFGMCWSLNGTSDFSMEEGKDFSLKSQDPICIKQVIEGV